MTDLHRVVAVEVPEEASGWAIEVVVQAVGVGLTLIAIIVALVAVLIQHRASVRQLDLTRRQATHDRLAELYDEIGVVCNQTIRVLHDTAFGRKLNQDLALDASNLLHHAVKKLHMHGGHEEVGKALMTFSAAQRRTTVTVAKRANASATQEDIDDLQDALTPFYARAREHLDRIWPERHELGDAVIGRSTPGE